MIKHLKITTVAVAAILGLVLYNLAFGQDVPDKFKVTLAWDANPEPDIAGYRVYHGTESGTHPNMTDVGNVTQATVPELPTGPRYYFVVTAYNEAGLESLPSNEVNAAWEDREPVIAKGRMNTGKIKIGIDPDE